MDELWAQCTWVSLTGKTEFHGGCQVGTIQTWFGWNWLILGMAFDVKIYDKEKFEIRSYYTDI